MKNSKLVLVVLSTFLFGISISSANNTVSICPHPEIFFPHYNHTIMKFKSHTSPANYDWDKIQRLIDDQKFKSAYSESQTLFRLASKNHDSRQMLVGARFLSLTSSSFMEYSTDSALARYSAILPILSPVEKSICHIYLAKFFSDYYANQRYLISSNPPSDEPLLDYKLWHAQRFQDSVFVHLQSAFSNSSLLQQSSSRDFNYLVDYDRSISDSSALDLTPSLFDVLLNEAFASVNSFNIEKLAASNVHNFDLLYAPSDQFCSLSLDFLNNEQQLAAFLFNLLQEKEQFHLNRKSSDELHMRILEHRIDNLNLIFNPQSRLDNTRYLKSVIQQFKSTHSNYITSLYASLASIYKNSDKVKAMLYIDTAISLYPQSAGAIRCENLRKSILQPSISIKAYYDESESLSRLALLTTYNVTRVHFRLVGPIDNNWPYNQRKQKLLKSKILQQWSMDIPKGEPFAVQQSFAIIPPMPQGNYTLLASYSPNFDSAGFVYESLSVNDIVLLPAKAQNSCLSGFIVDRNTGNSIPNQTISLYLSHPEKKLAELKSDANGFYNFSNHPALKSINSYKYLKLNIVYKGQLTSHSLYYYPQNNNDHEKLYERINIYTDRPIYKPGDTVSVAIHLYKTSVNKVVQNVSGSAVSVELLDINHQVIESQSLTVDSFGVAHLSFPLSQQAVPGYWHINAFTNDHSVSGYSDLRVEAYKQPKFVVSLSAQETDRHFGQSARVEGSASSYSQVPLNDALVEYTVTRSQSFYFKPWFRRWSPSEPTVVATGQLTTNANGLFFIDFVPLPDSNIDLSSNPSFDYTVDVKVTDLNGETHNSSIILRVGYVNSFINISQIDNPSNKVIQIGYYNLDSKLLKGQLNIEISQLKLPQTPLLTLPFSSDEPILKPLGDNTYKESFPYFDFDDLSSNYSHWQIAKLFPARTASLDGSNLYDIQMNELPAGVYHIVASTTDNNGDTIRQETYYVNDKPDISQPLVNDLLWCRLDKQSYSIGDKARLYVGSRHNDVSVFITINKSTSYEEQKLIHLSHNIQCVEIPITESLKDNFTISLAAVKHNVVSTKSFSVSVPQKDKLLSVQFESFRNKLLPGNKETWTVKIKGAENDVVNQANLMMTMYDHALDSYNQLNWSLEPWATEFTMSSLNPELIKTSSTSLLSSASYRNVPNLPFIESYLLDAFYYFRLYYAGHSRRHRLLMTKNSVSDSREEVLYEMAAPSMATADESELEESFMVVSDSDGATAKEVANALDSGHDSAPEPIRQNFNTLAFFLPNIRTNSDGTAELSFTVPDLLTEWTIKGLAWTQDLKSGTLDASAITQKPLMVVPNVPRFLYQGDSCFFSIKVSNMSDNDMSVDLSLELSDAATDAPLPVVLSDSSPISSSASKQLSLAPHSSSEVSFKLAIPEGNVFVANYKVIAKGQNCSDGEMGAIPLLTRRQLVTESVSFYINGKDEKHFELSHLTHLDTSAPDFTLQQQALIVDLTPNPIWLALQSIPYVSSHANPSNIFLSNSLYINYLSLNIVNKNPLLDTLFHEWREQEPSAFLSTIEQNSELSQIILSQIPWLNDAKSEEEQRQLIANFFDTKKINQQLNDDLEKLLSDQRPDGSWSWLPGGQFSNLYTTQYILKTFGLLQQQGVALDEKLIKSLNKAMDFVDEETSSFYRKYIKGSKIEPINLDYLYVRSWYTKNKMSQNQKEAFNFFYANAKKHNKSFQSLYSQSLLSLVFNRFGDVKLAKEMALRIKEKSLFDNEMGMYWRDNVSGFSWNERPIETQALLIRTFNEVLHDSESIARMQQWLLKQKQTSSWTSDVATVNAIQALLIQPNDSSTFQPYSLHPSSMTLSFGAHKIVSDTSRHQLHIRQRLDADSISPNDGFVSLSKADDGIAWGAMYWQYLENQEKVTASEMGISMRRSLYKVNNDKSLTPIDISSSIDSPHKHNQTTLRVGDRVHVRIELDVDRNLEYIELYEPRTASMEPVNTQSGWVWNFNLSYYLSITNTGMKIYIDRLDKGKYVVEYDLYVNNAGVFSTAPSTIQCLYAPEFRALCPIPSVSVEPSR